jgi:tetratricopeptide (TPR) repeat protein
MGFFGKNNVNSLYEEALDLATTDDEECIRCYDKIIKINSNEGMAWRGKGLALGRLGRPQAAIECYDEALKIDPYDDIAQRSKDIEIEEFKAIDTMTHSPDMSSLVTKGLELELDKKYEEAIQCYDEALKINPNDESVWENKADALGSLDKFEEAIQCYDEALKINPENDYALKMKGSSFASLEKYEEAIQCYDEALEINPENEHVLTMKGTGLFQLKKYEAALQCYDEALEINPENEHALTMKDQLTILVEAVSNNISDDVPKEMLYRNLENLSNPSSAFMKASELFQLKKYEEAIPHLKKSITSPEVDGMLGLCFRNMQKYDESIIYFDKLLSVEPENGMFLNFKGFSLRDLERWNEFVTIQTKLLEINPQDDSAWQSKSTGLFQLSKYDEAIFCCDKALEIDPDNAENWFNKAEVLDKLCKYSESISCYEKGFKINPEDPDISDWSSDDGTAMQSLDAVKAKLSENSSSKSTEKIEVIEKSEPLDVLKMRLAKGEISLDEFNKIKEHLE